MTYSPNDVNIGDIGTLASGFLWDIRLPIVIVLGIGIGFFIVETIINSTYQK